MNGVCKQTATRMYHHRRHRTDWSTSWRQWNPHVIHGSPCNGPARVCPTNLTNGMSIGPASRKWNGGGCFFVKSGPFLNAGCIMYSISIFYFTFYLFAGGCVRTQRTPFLRACAVRRAAAAAVLRCPATSAIDRYLLPAGPTAANPPQRRAAAGWDGRTRQRRTDTRQIHRPCSARYAGIANNTTCIALNNGNMSFSAAGPRLWNDLPPGLRRPGLTFDSFRQSLKSHLFGDRSACWLLNLGAIQINLSIYLYVTFVGMFYAYAYVYDWLGNSGYQWICCGNGNWSGWRCWKTGRNGWASDSERLVAAVTVFLLITCKAPVGLYCQLSLGHQIYSA